jgi:hypothetical protein
VARDDAPAAGSRQKQGTGPAGIHGNRRGDGAARAALAFARHLAPTGSGAVAPQREPDLGQVVGRDPVAAGEAI